MGLRLADGSVRFMGRRDHQVKIRGFRVELGDIEQNLAEHPAVREAVVVVQESGGGEERIAAYFTANGQAPDAVELRAYLKRKLPEHMIPSSFVPVKSFPLARNGKIDRRALPAPERGPERGVASPPRDPFEEAIAGMWCDLLHLNQVGIHDNFFDLGGHSLLAVRLLSWLRDVFRVELSVRALFAAPTVAELAGQIGEALSAGEQPLGSAIEPMARPARLPLSFAQQRLWFLQQWEGGGALYNVAQGWWLRGPLQLQRLRAALARLIARHEALRTAVVSEQGVARQQVRAEATVELPLIDLTGLAPERARAQALEQAQALARQGFDLTHAPLLRVALIRLGAEEHLLVLVIHHIVCDGWSIGVLRRELSALYEEPSRALPALPIQYADYAVWQRQWLQGEVLARQLGYWREKLADLSALELPTDRPRPAAQSYRGGRQALALSAELSAALKRLSRSERVTPYMLLLGAFKVLLARYSGQDDIAVGSPIAGRTQREIEGLIGFFVNTLVLRTDLSGNPTFS